MSSSSSSDYSDYDESDNYDIPAQNRFDIVPISIPINFTIFMNPARMSEVHINESCLATVTSRKTTQLVKVVPTPNCPPNCVQIPKFLQRTLDASAHDTVGIIGYDTKAKAESIQVFPLFDTNGVNYTNEIKRYFSVESHPISIGATFSIFIDSSIKIFRISNILPIDRCCTTNSTRITLIDRKSLSSPNMGVLSRHFSDLALPSEILNHVNKFVNLPLQHPKLLRVLGVRSSNGVLFYGQKGTGKTSLLIAISRELRVKSLTIKAPELFDMPVDQAMTKLQQGFSTVLDHTPALLLIDDIGKLAGKSDSSTPTSVRRLRSFFVSLLDRALLVPGLVVVATANSRDEIDPNLLRFGRFAFETNLELPSSAQRAEILRLNTQGLHIEQEDIIKLAGKTTDGKNCENIENIAELGVYAMIKRNVSSNNEFPTDNEIVQSSNSQLLLTYFPVNIIDDVPRLNTGGHSHESGLTIMDMMGGKSSNKMHNSGDPLAGNIGMGLGDDSDGGLFGKMSKQPGTTGGMAPINMGSLFGGGSPSKPSSETDMFGRPIQKTETDMFGRVKSNSPQPTSPPSSNDISPPGDNADMFGRPKENASSNDGDSSNNQSDPFAGFGSPNINPFGAQASSKPEQPNDPFGGFGTFGGGEESKSNAQQNDPFDGFGSNTGQSNPFGSFGSPNNQANEPQKEEEKAQNNPFGGFGSSNNSGFGSENSKESKQEEKPNPFSSPSYSSSNSTPPDPFANFGFGGSTSQNQPEEPKANDQPVNPSSTQPSNEPDPFANYGSPNQPSNPFAAPPEEPNQTEQKPFVSFGTKSTKFAPQESSQAGDSRDQFADFRQGSNSAAQQQPDPFAPSQPESSQTNQQSDPFANNSFGGAQSGDPTPQPNPFANNGFGSSSAPTNQPDPFASNGFGAASQTTNSAAPTNQPDPFASNGFGAASQTTNSAAPTNQPNPFASNGFGASSQPTQSIQQDPFGAGGFGGQQSQNNNNQQQVPFATNGFGGAPTPNPGIQQDPFAAGGFGGQSQPQQPVQDPFGGQVAPSPASQPQFGSGGFGANPQFGQGGFAQPSPFMQQNRRNAPVMLGGGGIRDMFYEGGGNNQPQSNPLAQQQQAQQPVEYTPMITPNVPEEAKKEVKPTIDIFGELPHSKPQPLDSLSSQSQQPAQQQQQQMQNQQIQNQQMQNQQMQQNQFRGGAGGYGSGYGGGMPYNNYGGAGYGMMGNNAGYNDPFNAPPANNFGGGYGGAPVGFNASPAAFGGYNAGNQYGGGGYGGFNGAPSGFGGAPSGGFGGNQPQAGSGGGFGNQQQIQQNKPQADDPFDKYNPLK